MSADPYPMRSSLVAPTRDDPVVGALSEVVGGRRGRYAASGRPAGWADPVLAVCALLAAASMALAVLARQHCRATLWHAPEQFTNLCYSDITAVFSAGGLGDGVRPYLDTSDGAYLAQPVGTGGLFALLGALAPGGDQQLRWVFDIAAVLLTVCLIGAVIAVAALAGRRAWDAALVAASPVVAASALVSLDLAAVSLAMLGLWAFSRSRPALSGVLLGTAVTVRPVALVVLIAIVIVAQRRRATRVTGPVLVAAGLGWTGLNAVVALTSFQGWMAYWSELARARLSYGSLLLTPQVLGAEIGDQTLPTPSIWLGGVGLLVVLAYVVVLALAPASLRADLRPRSWPWTITLGVLIIAGPLLAVGFGAQTLPRFGTALPEITGQLLISVGYPVVLATVWWLVHRAEYPPRIPVVALMLLCGLLLVSPAVPVQAAIWVLPLLALSLPSWRLMIGWAAVEVGYSSMTWLYLYGQTVSSRGAPAWLYLVLLFARVGMLVWLGWRCYSVSAWPADDVVRRDVGDDPAAGPLLGTVPALPPTDPPTDAH